MTFVFLLFDVSDRSSFKNLGDYIEHFHMENYNDIRMLYIIGNKTDKEIREVSKDEAEELASMYDLCYFEVSVKENKGIDDIFNKALESVC